MTKTQMLMNHPVFLGLSILDLSKSVMYEFWYDFIKLNIVKNLKCVSWIQTTSLFMTFKKTLQKMLTLQVFN